MGSWDVFRSVYMVPDSHGHDIDIDIFLWFVIIKFRNIFINLRATFVLKESHSSHIVTMQILYHVNEVLDNVLHLRKKFRVLNGPCALLILICIKNPW